MVCDVTRDHVTNNTQIVEMKREFYKQRGFPQRIRGALSREEENMGYELDL